MNDGSLSNVEVDMSTISQTLSMKHLYTGEEVSCTNVCILACRQGFLDVEGQFV